MAQASSASTSRHEFGVTPTTVLYVGLFLVLLFILWPLISMLKKFFGFTSNAATEGAQRINKALDTASEQTGYENSAGQTDPSVRYNNARVAYAKAQGYQPGDAEWTNPPGFPDRQTWLDQNPVESSSWVGNFLNSI